MGWGTDNKRQIDSEREELDKAKKKRKERVKERATDIDILSITKEIFSIN